mmetsp:Transcript_48550/g.71175  ORF Transcript_48550/g.71175 Transcript_48550/m.71175 type:complete len:81 (+) Transcript_48550:19-261(+)
MMNSSPTLWQHHMTPHPRDQSLSPSKKRKKALTSGAAFVDKYMWVARTQKESANITKTLKRMLLYDIESLGRLLRVDTNG